MAAKYRSISLLTGCRKARQSEVELFGIVLIQAGGKIQSRVQFAARIEPGRASWTGIGGYVIGNTQFVSTDSAEYCVVVEAMLRPHLGRVISQLVVT